MVLYGAAVDNLEMWLLVTIAPQEEISQAGREDNFYMEKTVELSWQAQSWFAPWWYSLFLPIHQGEGKSRYPVY